MVLWLRQKKLANLRYYATKCILPTIGLCVCGILLQLVTSHSRNDDTHPNLTIKKCERPTEKKHTFPQNQNDNSIISELSHSQSTFDSRITLFTTSTTPELSTTFKPCIPIQKSLPIQRAILIYYPHDQSEYFFPEVLWLYRSWAEILLGQPSTWRTDFIVYTYNFSTEFRRLGCVNRLRENKEEPSMCRLFLYVPVKRRTKNITENNFAHAFDDAKRVMASYNDTKDPFVGVPRVNDTETFDGARSLSLYAYLRTYGYIDSINTIYEGYWTFKMYDFVLRTDIDVFIYRHFSTYIPMNCTFIAGRGGYGTDFNRRRLRRIAHDMGFAHANISGMGSTWYGTAYDSYLVANQTLHGMLWLAQYEFAKPEREAKLGVALWPEWHYGVLLLYGQHLALNHLVAMKEIRILIGNTLLDQSSTDTSVDYVQKGIRLNFHCWHTSKRFSKFHFKAGRYNQTELELYRNDTTAQAYSMRMALESKYMTLEELAAYGRNRSSRS